VIGKFLAFLARDMANGPSRIGPVASEARHVEETSRPSVRALLSGESLSASDHEDRADEQQHQGSDLPGTPENRHLRPAKQ
jgi:hypothetical protein